MKKRLTAMIFLFSSFWVLVTGGVVSAEVDFTQQDRERMIRLGRWYFGIWILG